VVPDERAQERGALGRVSLQQQVAAVEEVRVHPVQRMMLREHLSTSK